MEKKESWACSDVRSVALGAVTSLVLMLTCKLSKEYFQFNAFKVQCFGVKILKKKLVFRSGQKHAKVALKLARASTDFWTKT